MATYAVIIADLNSSELGVVVSMHRTLKGAGKSYASLDNKRGAYVAARNGVGSYPHRIDGLDAGTTEEALAALDDSAHRYEMEA